jgi:hypothetical protein
MKAPAPSALCSLAGLHVLLLSAPSEAAAQGALTPPGPPAPSMKSLAQVEPRTPIPTLPFTITNAGAYYLTTNLVGASGSPGITITASDVALDLNGFSLIGVPGALTGVTSAAPAVALTVRNGALRNWPGGALNLAGPDARLEGLNVQSNGGAFAVVAGAQARLRDCTVAHNTGAGVSIGPGGAVRDCVLRHNAGVGALTGDGALVQDCTVHANAGHGLVLGNASSLAGGSVRTNAQNGVVGLTNTSIARCSIALNSSNGVFVTVGGRVVDCLISSNRVDGIRAVARCTLTGNAIDFNGYAGRDAGIRLLGSDNRVEDNNVTSHLTGILSDLGYNLIVRNKCTVNNTNFSFHASDVAGPAATNAATAGPWANFAF